MRHEENYKGFRIEFEEARDCFSAYLDGEMAFENPSLKGLKTAIDDHAKKQFKRFDVYYRGFGYRDDGIFGLWTVTSLVGGSAWIIRKSDKRREKVGTIELIPVDPHNTKIVGELMAIEKQSKKLEEEKEALEAKLKRIKTKTEE